MAQAYILTETEMDKDIEVLAPSGDNLPICKG
jgi:hypothetical protein